jgi:hypothetical protein
VNKHQLGFHVQTQIKTLVNINPTKTKIRNTMEGYLFLLARIETRFRDLQEEPLEECGDNRTWPSKLSPQPNQLPKAILQ